MTILLKQVFAFLKLLNSDKGSNQISAGIACGMILGFTPAFSIPNGCAFRPTLNPVHSSGIADCCARSTSRGRTG